MDSWIYECSEHHTECVSGTQTVLPTRVIDIGDEGDDPILVMSQGRQGRWVSLSHCWGKVQPMKTEIGSLRDRFAGLPLLELPPLFQDAITITRRFGYKYLWIDSLCIVQDSLEDWNKESANMGHIYKNSALTIAAEVSPDSQAGIFDSSNMEREWAVVDQIMVQISCHSSKRGLKGNLICGRGIGEANMCRGPLSERAWILQETILSPRVLRFANEQIWWQCREAQWNERIPYGRDHFTTNSWDSGSSSRISRNLFKLAKAAKLPYRDQTLEPLWLWYDVVNDFTARSIRYDKDKFPAISGVAKEVKRNSGQEYKAGLWLDDMHLGLLWSPVKSGATRSVSYVAPSWSWASVDFDKRKFRYNLMKAIYHHDLCNYGLARHAAKIIDVSINNVKDDPFGQVKSGSLTLHGPLQKICLCNIPHSFLDCHDEGDSPEITFETIMYNRDTTASDKASLKASELCNVNFIAELPCTDKTDVPHKEGLYLHIASRESPQVAFVLILEREGNGTSEIYQRIGMGMLREPTRTDAIWSSQTVTIL